MSNACLKSTKAQKVVFYSTEITHIGDGTGWGGIRPLSYNLLVKISDKSSFKASNATDTSILG